MHSGPATAGDAADAFILAKEMASLRLRTATRPLSGGKVASLHLPAISGAGVTRCTEL